MSNLRNALIRAVACLAATLSGWSAQAQETTRTIPYGANPQAGHYLRVGDANIYYETYGSGGTPLVLLHGGLYGYIDEFRDLIAAMSRHRRVIAIATRGHGKSELGSTPFSYALYAKDAFTVIRHETSDSVDVLGFSDGAITAYALASAHPRLVRRLVAIGGARKVTDWTRSAQAALLKSRPSDVERDDPQFVADRKQLMPQPERWLEFNQRLKVLWSAPVYVTDRQVQSISAPTLILTGDRDPYNRITKTVELFQLLPNGELAIIPGCGHVVLACKPDVTIRTVEAFFDRTAR